MGSDNKRIAKNTMMLYIRMLLIMAVTLYTSRVVLKVLGIEDYGIYNLIAGFVTFLVFISNSLVSSMQRYFNVSLGQNDSQRYKEVFSMSLNILFLFSILIILLGETVGLWFVHNHLNIPEERFSAAMWVYQISLLTFVANTLRTPFSASIIAHERMSFYAYISIIEVLLRLAMVFLLMWIPYDHLIMYALLYLGVIIGVDLLNIAYCVKKFEVCHYSFKKDNTLFKELMGFSGWSLLGQSAVVVKNQGEAIFINRFFTVAANAALGVAAQVTNAIEMFVTNFQTAFKPQITQSLAAGNYCEHHTLVCRSSKFSYYLLLIMLVPVTFNIDAILNFWLKEVPQYTNYFVVFVLISYLFSSLSSPLTTSIFASGNIKKYQICLSVIFLLGLASVYICLKIGCMPYVVSIVSVFIQLALSLLRLYFCHRYSGLDYRIYFSTVLKPVLKTSAVVWIFPVLYLRTVSNISFLWSILFDLIITGLIIWLIGLNSTERGLLKKLIIK